eukprot:scaffold50472_cov93-Phaeocystis_antarctica.AAC.1
MERDCCRDLEPLETSYSPKARVARGVEDGESLDEAFAAPKAERVHLELDDRDLPPRDRAAHPLEHERVEALRVDRYVVDFLEVMCSEEVIQRYHVHVNARVGRIVPCSFLSNQHALPLVAR